MKRYFLISLFLIPLIYNGSSCLAQSKRNDIPVKDLPKSISTTLEDYIRVLRTATDLDDCAKRFTALAGGSLVNEDGNTLRGSVKPYSLKKDFNNVKFYADPIKITRVNVQANRTTGYGPSALKGNIYKVWIAKVDGQAGMPAPISIILPVGTTTKTAKIVGIGSL